MPIKKTSTSVSAKKVTPKKVAKRAAPVKTAKKAISPKTKTVKKAAPKKSMKAEAKKPLVYADDQRSFWVKNGQVLNSLVALRDALDEMEKEVYLYHAGGAHNDFARWVSDVLADNACAVELSKAKSPKTAKSVVVKHLKFYAF